MAGEKDEEKEKGKSMRTLGSIITWLKNNILLVLAIGAFFWFNTEPRAMFAQWGYEKEENMIILDTKEDLSLPKLKEVAQLRQYRSTHDIELVEDSNTLSKVNDELLDGIKVFLKEKRVHDSKTKEQRVDEEMLIRIGDKLYHVLVIEETLYMTEIGFVFSANERVYVGAHSIYEDPSMDLVQSPRMEDEDRFSSKAVRYAYTVRTDATVSQQLLLSYDGQELQCLPLYLQEAYTDFSVTEAYGRLIPSKEDCVVGYDKKKAVFIKMREYGEKEGKIYVLQDRGPYENSFKVENKDLQFRSRVAAIKKYPLKEMINLQFEDLLSVAAQQGIIKIAPTEGEGESYERIVISMTKEEADRYNYGAQDIEGVPVIERQIKENNDVQEKNKRNIVKELFSLKHRTMTRQVLGSVSGTKRFDIDDELKRYLSVYRTMGRDDEDKKIITNWTITGLSPLFTTKTKDRSEELSTVIMEGSDIRTKDSAYGIAFQPVYAILHHYNNADSYLFIPRSGMRYYTLTITAEDRSAIRCPAGIFAAKDIISDGENYFCGYGKLGQDKVPGIDFNFDPFERYYLDNENGSHRSFHCNDRMNDDQRELCQKITSNFNARDITLVYTGPLKNKKDPLLTVDRGSHTIVYTVVSNKAPYIENISLFGNSIGTLWGNNYINGINDILNSAQQEVPRVSAHISTLNGPLQFMANKLMMERREKMPFLFKESDNVSLAAQEQARRTFQSSVLIMGGNGDIITTAALPEREISHSGISKERKKIFEMVSDKNEKVSKILDIILTNHRYLMDDEKDRLFLNNLYFKDRKLAIDIISEYIASKDTPDIDSSMFSEMLKAADERNYREQVERIRKKSILGRNIGDLEGAKREYRKNKKIRGHDQEFEKAMKRYDRYMTNKDITKMALNKLLAEFSIDYGQNRPLTTTIEPGSTMKPLSAAILMSSDYDGLVNQEGCLASSAFLEKDAGPQYIFGGNSEYTKVFHDTTKKRAHCFKDAITHSANTTFAIAGARLLLPRGPGDQRTENKICIDQYGFTVTCECNGYNTQCGAFGEYISDMYYRSPILGIEEMMGLSSANPMMLYGGDLSDLLKYEFPTSTSQFIVGGIDRATDKEHYTDALLLGMRVQDTKGQRLYIPFRSLIQYLYGTGGIEATPLYLLTAYDSLINYPKRVRPRLFKEGTEDNSPFLEKITPLVSSLKDDQVLDQVRSGMAGVIGSTYKRDNFNKVNRFTYAAKTGTSDEPIRNSSPIYQKLRLLLGEQLYQEYFTNIPEGRFIIYPNRDIRKAGEAQEILRGQFPLNSVPDDPQKHPETWLRRTDIPYYAYVEATGTMEGGRFAAPLGHDIMLLMEGLLP